jgi:DNA-binding NarL/FixJ family response regulator
MNELIKLAIVDDDEISKEILAIYLQKIKNIKVIITVSNGKELENVLIEQKQIPDVVLLDLEMPVMNGKETIEYLSLHYPAIRVLILTVHRDERISNELIEKGANGFLMKGSDMNVIMKAINTVYGCKYYFEEWDLKKIVAIKNEKKDTTLPNGIKFTDIELEVIKLLCKENTNQEISDKLFMSKRTVEGYRSRIYKKTKVSNTAGLVIYAMQYGLITIDNEEN